MIFKAQEFKQFNIWLNKVIEVHSCYNKAKYLKPLLEIYKSSHVSINNL